MAVTGRGSGPRVGRQRREAKPGYQTDKQCLGAEPLTRRQPFRLHRCHGVVLLHRDLLLRVKKRRPRDLQRASCHRARAARVSRAGAGSLHSRPQARAAPLSCPAGLRSVIIVSTATSTTFNEAIIRRSVKVHSAPPLWNRNPPINGAAAIATSSGRARRPISTG
jgi:hypothetical protein